MSHTPTPWHLGGIFNPNSPHESTSIWGATPAGLQSGVWIAKEVPPADAAYILKCVNAHEALTRQNAALRDALVSACSYLADYSRRSMWGTDSDADVANAQAVIRAALEAK